MLRAISLIQGIYFLITGIWPIVHIESFVAITGPKTDLWLVEMVGLLTVSISLLLIVIAIRRKISISAIVLIIASCISYILIDTIYVYKEVISSIYLADALLQAIFLILWFIWLGRAGFKF